MKKFKGVILALAMVLSIGAAAPREAYAIPTETKSRSWLEYPNGTTGEMVPAGRWYIPLFHLHNDRVMVAEFMSGVHVGSIHYSNLEDNHIVTHGVNFRSWTKVADNIIGYIPKGTTVLVTDEGGNTNWAQVRWNGKVGFISRQYVSPLKKFLPS